ncbi:MAG: phage tail sheath family protein [Oscillospiraceae bacterium]|nr:phage tail sheath family protein [Oscillospiraceae bacterium]
MAGGSWTAQNKVRPGIYINFTSRGSRSLSPGERGTLAGIRPLSWGPVGEIMEIDAGAEMTPYIGYGITTPQARFLREALKGTDVTNAPAKILLYRPAAADQAAASAPLGEGVTATALYPGVRGNDVSIIVTEDVDEDGVFTVATLVDGVQADQQTARTGAELRPNAWVDFTGDAALTATAGVTLSGGVDGTVSPQAYAGFLTALEPYSFDVLVYDGTDSTVRDAYAAFINRISSQEGRCAQLVTTGAERADSRFVISCRSGVVLESGETLTPQETVWWLAGAEAGAQYYQSLSCAAYPGAVDVLPRMTNSQIEAAILSGSIVLSEEFGQVRIETDVNTLTTYTEDIDRVFHKNRAMRSCSNLANDIYREFSLNYKGKVTNNTEGRGLFQGAVLEYLKAMYSKGALMERPAGDDVEVLAGDEPDSIVINVGFWLADAVEKIYMTVTVN